VKVKRLRSLRSRDWMKWSIIPNQITHVSMAAVWWERHLTPDCGVTSFFS
jgi:hypothetical protein